MFTILDVLKRKLSVDLLLLLLLHNPSLEIEARQKLSEAPTEVLMESENPCIYHKIHFLFNYNAGLASPACSAP